MTGCFLTAWLAYPGDFGFCTVEAEFIWINEYLKCFMLLIAASVPQTMTEKSLEQIGTEFQYGQGSRERDKELGLQIWAQLIQSQGLEFMAADRMRRGQDLLTLREWGHLDKATFWRSWQTSLVSCLPLLGKAVPKSLYKLPSMVVRSSARKNKIRVLLLQSCCSLLPLNCSCSQSNPQLASWSVAG